MSNLPAEPITGAEAAVHAALAALAIGFERHEHPPVLTVHEASAYDGAINATHCKNLFLRNRKGDRQFLVIAERSKQVDLRRLGEILGERRLGFASPARLLAALGLAPGAVSPFGLLNNGAKDVTVVLDGDLSTAGRVAFHPNVNTATLVLSWTDFERFLAWSGNTVVRLEL